jgi:DNA-3-methyladenine glycosylase I
MAALKKRCTWCKGDELYEAYHDTEWGLPEHNNDKLFEFVLLEGVQAGLSWITVLRRRENYRKVYDQFNAEKIARYTPKKIEKLLQNPEIIRNRLKVESAVKNARAYLDLRESGTDLDSFLWQFVDGEPIVNKWKSNDQVPAITKESELMSKELKRKGFNFVGPTITYALMQAAGLVNDHLTTCFRHKECQ